MRKLLVLLICAFLLCPRAAGAEVPQYIALTFDDGPSGKFTQRLLDGLRERDARVTFFLCGYRVAQYPELTERIAAEGHEIGLHGYNHRDLSRLSRRDLAEELSTTRALLPDRCQVRLLRPPGGCCSDALRQVAGVTGLSIIGWSVDPQDWATRDTAAVSRSVLEGVKDGDIVVLHDMSDTSVNAALNLIDLLRKQGFTLVTVSELAMRREIPLHPGRTYRSFPRESP